MVREKASIPIISIVMPVYNSKPYLDMAIQSVLKQSFEDFELLLVDDGSNDGSAELCDIYSCQDERIIVIHKKNGGVCSARNVGIKNSRGTYITFIDNDDVYEKEFLHMMLKHIKEADADIIKCGRNNVKIGPDLRIVSEKRSFYPKTIFIDFQEFSEQYCELRKGDILNSVWNGLYKIDMIKKYGLEFDEKIQHGNEDIIFNSDYIMCCNRIVLLKDVLYTHFYRVGHSTSMKFSEEQIITRIVALRKEMRIVQTFPKITQTLMMEGIRELFRLIIPVKDRQQRIKYIRQLETELDFKILRRSSVIRNTNLSAIAKVDLILIKFRMYDLYFGLRWLYKFLY